MTAKFVGIFTFSDSICRIDKAAAVLYNYYIYVPERREIMTTILNELPDALSDKAEDPCLTCPYKLGIVKYVVSPCPTCGKKKAYFRALKKGKKASASEK